MRPGCMRDRNKKKNQSILIVKQNALLFVWLLSYLIYLLSVQL